MQPQEKLTHFKYRETIHMLSLVVTHQFGNRGNRHDVANTKRIHEFLGMNSPRFAGSSVTEDPKKSFEVLQKIFTYCMLMLRG